MNTAGIGGHSDSNRRRKLFNYLKKHSSPKAIVFPQETHSTKKVENLWTSQWGCGKGSIHFSHGTSNSTGVLMAFREGLDVKIEATFTDNGGRLLILKAKIQVNPVILVNYHAPNEERAQVRVLSEVNSILDKIVLEPNSAFIWGGGEDFNLYFDIALETDGGNPKLKIKSLSKLLPMMQENDLCDLYRIRNPDEKCFTWRCRNPFLQRRLDYFSFPTFYKI